jgi:decaprenylphospho-beta-D-erythro-pentofuranosid-2-ulose 2-reductase
VQNALQEPQTIVLLGGTSEIGRAIVDELLSPAASTLVLACRRPDEAEVERFARPGLSVVAEAFRRGRHRVPRRVRPQARRRARRHRRRDRRVRGARLAGRLRCRPAGRAEAVHVNYTGAVTATLAVAGQMRRQGHGHIAVLSSVAGERGRAANYVYGSSKAGLDAFAQGLGDALAGTVSRSP